MLLFYRMKIMGAVLLVTLFSYGKPSIHQPYVLYVSFYIQWPYIQWISTVWNQPYENNVTSSTAHIIFIRLSLSNTCIRVWHQSYGNKLCPYILVMLISFTCHVTSGGHIGRFRDLPPFIKLNLLLRLSWCESIAQEQSLFQLFQRIQPRIYYCVIV